MDGAQLGEREVTGGIQRQREYRELLVTDGDDAVDFAVAVLQERDRLAGL